MIGSRRVRSLAKAEARRRLRMKEFDERIAAAIREQAASAEQPEPQPEWVRIENEARIRDGRPLHPGPIPRSAYRNNPYADD